MAAAYGIEVRPKLTGSMTTAAADSNSVDWSDFSGECSGSSNSGILRIEPPQVEGYVHVDGLHLRNSKCRGVKAKAQNASGIKEGLLLGIRVENMLVEYTGWELGTFETGIQNAVVRDSIFRHGNKCEQSERNNGTVAQTNNCTSPTSGWPQGVNLTRSENANSLFENNTVYYNYGEGISTFIASGVVVRGNRVGHTWGGTSYSNNTRGGCNVYESNIYYGSMNSQNLGNGDGSDDRRQYQAGVGSSVEDNVRTGDGVCNLIRNNYFLGVNRGLQADLESLAGAEGEDIDVRAYGNTLVEITGREIDVWNGLDSDNFGRFEARNNILASLSVTASDADRCRGPVDADYNLWTSSNSDSDCGGANDVTNGDPKFAETNNSNWLNKHQPTPPTFADIYLLTGSDALSAGEDLSSGADCITGTAFDWLDGEMSYPFTPVLATWKECNAYDAEGTARPNPPHIGAIQNTP